MDAERKPGRASELLQKMASALVPFRRSFRSACQEVVRIHGAEPWFNGTPWQRPYAREAIRLASRWGDRALPVHDIGCGIAQMIVLLQSAGFPDLSGCDREANHVAAAEDLCARFGVPAAITLADGVDYVRSLPPQSAGVMMTLNWTYHLDAAQTRDFLLQTRRALRGILIVDIIRADYSPVPNETQEYESSYRTKWTCKEFEACAAAAGLAVQARGSTHAWGRVVYALSPEKSPR